MCVVCHLPTLSKSRSTDFSTPFDYALHRDLSDIRSRDINVKAHTICLSIPGYFVSLNHPPHYPEDTQRDEQRKSELIKFKVFRKEIDGYQGVIDDLVLSMLDRCLFVFHDLGDLKVTDFNRCVVY